MFSSRLHFIYKLIMAFLTLVLFQNCSPTHKVGSQSDQLSSDSSSEFVEAKSIIENKCLQCHDGQGTAQNFQFNTERGFIQSGLIMPGNVESSPLITRLKKYTGKKRGLQNMPIEGDLSSGEYSILVNWVRLAGRNQESCNKNENLLKPQIKRLTSNQFKNSIVSVFGPLFTDSQFPVLSDANPRLDLANDPDLLQVNEVNINNYYDATLALSKTVTTKVTTVVNCINSTSSTCYQTVLQQYAPLLWRRPLTKDELTDLSESVLEFQNSGLTRAQVMNYLLTQLILSPNHLFRTELGDSLVPQVDIFFLSQFEIASLLSFSIWDSPPDSILYDLAEKDQLYSVDVLRTQVTRMMADSKAPQKLSTFIVDLLKLEDVKTASKASTYAVTALERSDLYQSAIQGLQDIYATPSVDLLQPFQMQSFYTNSRTARFFNLPTTGLTTTLQNLPMNSSERYGILSHPAFLSAIGGEIESGIVKRGVFTLEQLLCHHLGPPPANVSPTTDLPSDFDPQTTSSREVLKITHSSQSSCIGCHSVIDPAGFAYESFNAVGTFRKIEKTNIPIDSSGSLSGIGTQDLQFANSIEYFQQIKASPDFKKCMEMKFFKYISGQTAEEGPGRCEFKNFENKFSKGRSSAEEAVQGMIELESFIRRKPASN